MEENKTLMPPKEQALETERDAKAEELESTFSYDGYQVGLHLMLCNPLVHLLGDGLDRAILKGDLQPGGLHQLCVAGQTGAAHPYLTAKCRE